MVIAFARCGRDEVEVDLADGGDGEVGAVLGERFEIFAWAKTDSQTESTGSGGADSSDRVFDDDAFGWRDRQSSCGFQIGVWIRFAVQPE